MKKFHQESKQPFAIADNKININNSVNNDCLIQIFKNLPMKDKLVIESVCKKWRDLGKSSWSNVKSLEISSKYFLKIFKKINKKKQPQLYQNLCNKINSFVINLISRCGPYLNCLIVNLDLDLDFSLIFTKILFYCKELTNFSLISNEAAKGLSIDPVLNLLFKNNKKISSISMENVRIDGVCFSNLCSSIVTELKVVKCTFKCKNFLNLFNNLKNINILNILYLNIEESEIIQSLKKSNFQNLHEFSFRPSWDLDIKYKKDLAEWISKQKMLSKLNIEIYTDRKENLLDVSSLEPYLFSRFENLTYLKIYTWYLTDNIMKIFSNCINLEILELDVYYYTCLCTEDNYFSNLQNLKKFVYHGSSLQDDIDHILKALSLCQNIKEIVTSHVNFKDAGLKSISALPNLTVLDISNSYFSKHKIINIVKNLLNLEKIYFSGFENGLNYKLLQFINKIKVNRGDTNSLKIILFLDKKKYRKYKESLKNSNDFSLLCIKIYLQSNLSNYNESDSDDSYNSSDEIIDKDNSFEDEIDESEDDDNFDSSDDEDFEDSDYS